MQIAEQSRALFFILQILKILQFMLQKSKKVCQLLFICQMSGVGNKLHCRHVDGAFVPFVTDQ